ncbi:MAG: hypothetical protein JWM86_2597 [Thermoleophilia bacterium]|nr:hypothetical protein [Thermoleophilia bacterium]
MRPPDEELPTSMQPPIHAAIGARTLGPGAPAQAWGDAFRSISLVGTSTTAMTASAAAVEPPTGRMTGPIDAARRWLADPERSSQLPADLVAQAHASIDVAEVHVRELDVLAGELAQDANDTGRVDAGRLDQLELMAEQLQAFSFQLRALLEPTGTGHDEVTERLSVALQASAHGGGLGALLSALR